MVDATEEQLHSIESREEPMMSDGTSRLILLGIILSAALLVGLVLWIFQRMKKKAGGDPGAWLRLTDRFGTTQEPPGKILTKQTVKIGSVLYRNCATIGVTSEGLYLTTWRKGVLIPWQEFGEVTQGRLFWERVPVFSIGHPSVATLAVPRSVLDLFRDSLPPVVQQRL